MAYRVRIKDEAKADARALPGNVKQLVWHWTLSRDIELGNHIGSDS